MQIDAHQHFWRYDPAEYAWIDAAVLKRDYLPEDLDAARQGTGIEGTIAVQARTTREETEWLLGLAASHAAIRGVVGWAPLKAERLEALLERWAALPKLVGLREVLQGRPDEAFFADASFNRGITLLKQHGLVYDILLFEDQLPAAVRFVDRHPAQVFVIDHLAKPRIRDGSFEAWARHIKEMARREHVVCKVSGMVTEARHDAWREDDLVPYLDAVLEAFGPSRLLFGSDWPVCLLAASYQRWYEVARSFFGRLSPSEQAQVFGGSATRVYGL